MRVSQTFHSNVGWIIASFLIAARGIASAPGDLDPTFGEAGLVNTSSQSYFSVAALVRQADGKLVAAGTTNTPASAGAFQLARFEIDGSPDSTFGGSGIVTTRVSGTSSAVQLLVQQPDGKLVAAGLVGPPQFALALVRYNSDGTLDRGFGHEGIVVGDNAAVFGLAALFLQPDGKIIVVIGGASTLAEPDAPVQLVRYRSDGSIDLTYPSGNAPGSPTSTDTGAPASAFLQSDGAVMVGVRTSSGDPALVRYDAQGSVDFTYGKNGVLTLDKGDGCCDFSPTDIIGLPDGRLAVAVIAFESGATGLRPTYRIYVVTPGGALDSAFGAGGSVAAAYGDFLPAGFSFPWSGVTSRLAIGADGKLLQIGVVESNAHLTPLVLRYDLRGVRDETFGMGGAVMAPSADLELQPDAVALQPDGKLVIGGPGFLARYVLGGAAINTAVEYHDAEFDDYFVTSIPAEIEALDSQAIAGWQRSGQYFSVYSPSDGKAVPMCRFFSGTTFAPQSTHFLTPFGDECAKLESDRAWIYEGAVMPVQLPESGGVCPPGTMPLYRLFNSARAGAPMHRYTIGLAIRAQALEDGWEAEGEGPVGVTGCVPMQ